MLNESLTLPALAAGCRPIISSYYIGDDYTTTDDSSKIAKEVFNYCPGIVTTEFYSTVNEKRNNVLEAAREGCDYLLITNSDEPPVLRGQLPELTAPLYALTVRDIPSSIEFYGAYLLRSDTPAHWKGRVHEYLFHQTTVTHLPHIKIYRNGSMTDQTTREHQLTLLAEDIATYPEETPRLSFYIAQTLLELHREAEATFAYLKRAGMVGFVEETYYALYAAANLMQQVDADAALSLFHRAINYRFIRPEAYHGMSNLMNILGRYEEALYWAKRGLALPPSTDLLLVNRWIEQIGLHQQAVIAQSGLTNG